MFSVTDTRNARNQIILDLQPVFGEMGTAQEHIFHLQQYQTVFVAFSDNPICALITLEDKRLHTVILDSEIVAASVGEEGSVACLTSNGSVYRIDPHTKTKTYLFSCSDYISATSVNTMYHADSHVFLANVEIGFCYNTDNGYYSIISWRSSTRRYFLISNARILNERLYVEWLSSDGDDKHIYSGVYCDLRNTRFFGRINMLQLDGFIPTHLHTLFPIVQSATESKIWVPSTDPIFPIRQTTFYPCHSMQQLIGSRQGNQFLVANPECWAFFSQSAEVYTSQIEVDFGRICVPEKSSKICIIGDLLHNKSEAACLYDIRSNRLVATAENHFLMAESFLSDDSHFLATIYRRRWERSDYWPSSLNGKLVVTDFR